MDIAFARLARKQGCGKCVWYKRSSNEGFGYCLNAPPRTSGQERWPSIGEGNWCSAWLPAEEEHNGTLPAGNVDVMLGGAA